MNQKRIAIIGLTLVIIIASALGYFTFVRPRAEDIRKLFAPTSEPISTPEPTSISSSNPIITAPRPLPIYEQKGKAAAASTYNAISDLFLRPKPPLPRLGPAGTVIVDSAFGTRILRVTDADTSHLIPESRSNSFSGPSGGFELNWNADSSMFWVAGEGGTVLLYALDPVTFTSRPLKDPKNPEQILTVDMGEPWFSSQDPNLLYGIAGERGHTMTQYNIAQNTYTPLFDLEKAVPLPGPEQYASLLSVDYTDTFYSVAFGDQQDGHMYLIAWNRKTGDYTLLNTKESTVKPYDSATARPTNLQLGVGIHASSIDRTGRYVNFGGPNIYAPKTDCPNNVCVWDTRTGHLKAITVDWPGHDVMGFGYYINHSGANTPDGGGEGEAWSMRSLDFAGLDHPTLLTPLPAPPYRYVQDSHISWNNARPDVLVPFAAALYGAGTDWGFSGSTPWPPRAWENEIIAIATDGSKKVWRFAHHRSSNPDPNLGFDANSVPRGNISQNGKYYLFTSNWERTLGTDPDTKSPRSDVFIVELDQKFPVPPPSTDTLPSPALRPLNLPAF